MNRRHSELITRPETAWLNSITDTMQKVSSPFAFSSVFFFFVQTVCKCNKDMPVTIWYKYHTSLNFKFQYHNTCLTPSPPTIDEFFISLLQIPGHHIRLLIWLQITLPCDKDKPFLPLFNKFYRAIKRTMLTRSCFHVILTFDNPDKSQACPDTLY